MEDRKRKGTIFASGLVLCLCVVALTVVTVGLLKHECAAGTVGLAISAGRLELDIVDAQDHSLVNQTLQFIAEDDTEVLLEPGRRLRSQDFRVMNRGDMPLQFRISVDAGETDFFEAFEVWIVTCDEERMEGEVTERLEANAASERFCLVIQMKESAGNAFQGKTYSGLRITVDAVQQPGRQE